MTKRDELKAAIELLDAAMDAPPVGLTGDELKRLRIERARAVDRAARHVLAEVEGRKLVLREARTP